MDTAKLTAMSRDAVSIALRSALTHGNPNAEPVHLLEALLTIPDNTVGPLLDTMGADPRIVDAAAKGAITKLPPSRPRLVSTSPASRTMPSPSRIVIGATPKRFASVASLGSRSPATNTPRVIASVSRLATCSARPASTS